MPSDKIPQIFTNSGIRDPLEWLRRNLDTPFNVLVARLQPGLPPIDVEAFCKCWALDHRRFPEFAKLRAVNRIREQFSGIGIDNERAFCNADAGAWSSWAWLLDPFQKSDARVIWEMLMERVKHSHWIPQSETDPNLVECFQGNDLEPREDARRFRRCGRFLTRRCKGPAAPIPSLPDLANFREAISFSIASNLSMAKSATAASTNCGTTATVPYCATPPS